MVLTVVGWMSYYLRFVMVGVVLERRAGSDVVIWYEETQLRQTKFQKLICKSETSARDCS